MVERVLSKRQSVGRKLTSLFNHSFLIARQVTLAVAGACAWWLLLPIINKVPHHDRDIILNLMLVAVVPFSVLGAEIVRRIWDKYGLVMEAVKEKDWRTIVKQRDERIPTYMHILLAAPAGLVIGYASFLDFSSHQVGAVVIFTICLLFAFFWAAIGLLERPTESSWLRERVPATVLTVDVDKFLGLHEEHDEVELGAEFGAQQENMA